MVLSFKGESKHDTYGSCGRSNSEYDFIFLVCVIKVLSKKLAKPCENDIKGTLVFFYNFWGYSKGQVGRRFPLCITLFYAVVVICRRTI